MVAVRLTDVTFSGGTQVKIPETGVVLFVGPNNSGKSQALRDIINSNAHSGNYIPKAIVSSTVTKGGSVDEFADWVRSNTPQIQTEGRTEYFIEGWTRTSMDGVVSVWPQAKLGFLARLFIFHVDATARLNAGNSVPNIDFSVAHVENPIQKAYIDPDFERTIDRLSREAFGLGMTIDRYNGGTICVRVGDPPHFEHTLGAPRTEYISGLHAMPRLEDQGDGVRSYVGLLLHTLAGSHQITLIDEPEAFLHPPQARRLGHFLASRAGDSQQVILATHSSDIVQGALDSGSDATIVRITRTGNKNFASVLDSSAIQELWRDPLLRHSNLMDGLFHDAVVLCEADSDCRYYAAVRQALEASSPSSSRKKEVLFTHCGGKARMATVAKSLRAAGVPVVIVSDFDVLREEGTIRRIVESVGGNYNDFAGDVKVIQASLDSDVKQVNRIGIRQEFDRRWDSIASPTLDRHDLEQLRSIFKIESGWDKIKRGGMGAIPQGNPSECADRLLKRLSGIGILIVPVGELERFVPNVPGHGPTWVSDVLERRLHQTPNHDAKSFVELIDQVVRDKVDAKSQHQGA